MAIAEAGDTFEMADGSRYILRTPGAAVDGDYVEFEWVFPPGTFAPPPHLHPAQVEEYEVLEGRLDVMVGDEWRSLREGESASVPAGVIHTFKRPESFVRVRNFHRPALGFEAFIEQMCRVGKEKNLRGVRDPRLPVYLAMVWRGFPETLQATRARHRLGMRIAGGAGALLRMKP